MLTEEELRSHPLYVSYYYAHGNFNPRLPPPLLSKEDWRAAQRFQVGGSSSEGTRDWWKKQNVCSDSDISNTSSLFSIQPGLGVHKNAESDLIEMRKNRKNSAEWVSKPDGLIGLSASGMGCRRKSFADILQEGLEQSSSSSNRISRPASQNDIFTSSHSSSLVNENVASSFTHTYAPVVGSSVSRRAPGPGLPPVSSIVRPADVAASLSSLNLSKSHLLEGDNYSQCNNIDVINDQRLSFKHRFVDNSRKDNLGPVSFHRRAASSADLNSNRNMFDFSNLDVSHNQVSNFTGMDLFGRMPTRYSAANNRLA
ncbi:hypothetical protein M8C21_022405, partial [Ambrosia artemisiifolia]